MAEINEQGLENAKKTIVIIERLLFAMNNTQFPLRFAGGALEGADWLQRMHQGLIEQIGPEEVQKMRDEFKTNVPPPPPLAKPNGLVS